MPEELVVPQSAINAQLVKDGQAGQPTPDTTATPAPDAEATQSEVGQDILEAAPTLERSRQAQRQEVETLAGAILYGEVDAIDKTLSSKTEQESNQILGSDEKLRKLYSVKGLTNLPQGETIPFTGGNPVSVDGNQILEVTGLNDNEFTCRIKTPEGAEMEGVTLQRTRVVQAQVVAEASVMRQNFSGEQQQVFDLYVTSLKGDEAALENLPPEQVDALLLKAREGTAMLTPNMMTTLVKKRLEEQNLSEAERQTLEEAVASLEGTVVVTPQVAKEIFGAMGITNEGIAKQLADFDQQAGALHTLSQNPNIEIAGPAARQLQALIKLKSELQARQEANGEKDPVDDLVDKMYAGNADPEKVKQFTHALQTGDIDKIVAAAIEDDPNLSEEENRTRKQEIAEILKKTGGGTALLLVFLSIAVYQSAKALK